MTSRDIYLLAAGAFATVLISTAMIAKALENHGPETSETSQPSTVGRWQVQQSIAQGWNVFDTQTGRMCTVPFEGPVNCSAHPLD